MDQPQEAALAVEEQSLTFVGRWNRLVSTTNWQKGRIISEWRQALVDSGAGSQEYSDETWARHVNGVSPQHVGRLRRVWDRFGDSADRAPQLFWSHYQATLDWNDAEMWLEGATLENWSVAEMRRRRWEAQGGSEEQKPRDEDIVHSEFDEDAPDESSHETVNEVADVLSPEEAKSRHEDDDEEAPFDDGSDAYDDSDDDAVAERDGETRAAVAPFADLADLPADLADAFEQMKLAIVRHRAAGWEEIAPRDVIASLRALELLVNAGGAA